MARDRPSPYDEGGVFFRSAGDRQPRALECADDGEGQVFPQPYDEVWKLNSFSRGQKNLHF